MAVNNKIEIRPPETGDPHKSAYTDLCYNEPGSSVGINPFEESLEPQIGESWVEDINLKGTDRGFGRGEGYEPGDAATGSFPAEFAESLSEA